MLIIIFVQQCEWCGEEFAPIDRVRRHFCSTFCRDMYDQVMWQMDSEERLRKWPLR